MPSRDPRSSLLSATPSTVGVASARPNVRTADSCADADATRTSTGESAGAPARVSLDDRLPAPLQCRDPHRYEMLGEHGRGGLGRVFRAYDRELGRDVAVKELLQRGTSSELRFVREALITARLEHPGIVPVHEAGRWPDGTPFYAMKMVAGRPLKALIEAAVTLEDRLALIPHVLAVADAIAYAHDHRIIHRDLKPSNVMVGDFGETVVIDWGLAKDLREAAFDVADQGPYRTAAPAGLTVAGSVLGTPAYMAPEQFSGAADERSDIYALGGILYHVLTGVTPHDRSGRDGLPLRRREIATCAPRDVLAIAERAMAAEPARRYPDARAFADDLRRFTQHRPVAARRYSLAARVALGFARHRTVATVAAIGLVLVTVIAIFAAIRLGHERDAAVAAARAARAAEQERLLNHAELLLTTDPTASAEVLDDYTGADTLRRQWLGARARGLGVATWSAYPHVDTVRLIETTRDGGVITVGEDQLVVLTRGAEERVLARDVHPAMIAAYARTADALAYARYPRGVALIQVDTEVTTVLSGSDRLRDLKASANGQLVAGVTVDAAVVLWRLSDRQELVRSSHPGAHTARWVDDDRLAIATDRGVDIVDLQLNTVRSERLEDVKRLAAARGVVVAIDAKGHGLALHGGDLDAVRFDPCSGPASSVEVTTSTSFVVGCRDGRVAIWDVAGRELERLATTGTIYCIEASEDGRHLVLGGEARVVFVYDTVTRILYQRRGHPASIYAVRAPRSGAPFSLSADGNGTLRRWPIPESASRLAFQAPTTIYGTEFTPDGRALVADANDGVLRVMRVEDGRLLELRGHTAPIYGTRFAPSHEVVASFGFDGTVWEWDLEDGRPLRVLQEHEGRVVDVRYLPDGTALSAGVDGKLLGWKPGATRPTVWFSRPAALNGIKLLRDDSVVVYDAENNVWIVEGPDRARLLTTAGTDMIRVMRLGPDGQTILLGTSSGRVIQVDALGGSPAVILDAGAPIRDVVAAADLRSIAVASEDGFVHLRSPHAGDGGWARVAAHARFLAFAATQDVMAAVCVDGSVWFRIDGRWLNVQVHTADVQSGYFSADDRWFVTSDVTGRVVVHDLALLRGMPPNQRESEETP